MIVVIVGPLLIVFLFTLSGAFSLSNTSSETIKIAQEIQADFNGQYPTTLSNYKGWKTEESNYGYTAIKKINSEITDTLMYKAINNGESFELAFTHSVDIYRFRPVNGQIQRL